MFAGSSYFVGLKHKDHHGGSRKMATSILNHPFSLYSFSDISKRFTSMNIPTFATVCQACGGHSFSIFGYGWVCTQSGCRAFFQLLDKTNVVTEGYNSAFLAPREDPPAVRSLKLEIRPKPPVQPVIHSNAEQAQIATSRHHWKGFWCEKCGKLSCRSVHITSLSQILDFKNVP